MKGSVFGLGYVGTVSAAYLAHDGHDVVGVDPAPSKVDRINAGKSPIIEANIQEIIAGAVSAKRLRAIQDPATLPRNRIIFRLRRHAEPDEWRPRSGLYQAGL